MPSHMEGAVVPVVACKKNVSQRKAPGAMSAMAFIVKPVSPSVGFISGAVFSAINTLLQMMNSKTSLTRQGQRFGPKKATMPNVTVD